MLTKWTAGLLGSAVVIGAGLWFGAGVESASTQTTPSTAGIERQDQADMTKPYTATVEEPAVLPLPTDARATPGKADFVVVKVLGFTPPAEGSVTAVVKMRDASGSERVLGNFGLFPSDSQFQAATPDDAQRFAFRLPAANVPATDNASAEIIVDLVPDSGEAGKGAILELGGVEVQQR